jgi:hypothetical protein
MNEIVMASDVLRKKIGVGSHLRSGMKSKIRHIQHMCEIEKYFHQVVLPVTLRKEPLKERLRRLLQRTYKSILW